MSQFSHEFKLVNCSESYRLFAEKDTCIRLDFLSESIFRVAVYKKNEYMLPTFDIDPSNELSENGRDKLSTVGFPMYKPGVYEEGETEKYTLGSGIEIKLSLKNFCLEYYKNNRLLFKDRAPLAYNFENEFGQGHFHYISREKDEKIFGLGDKGGKFNKYGREFRIETSDSMGYDAENTDVLYKHVPFFICDNSVGSYGIFYDTSCDAYFNLGNEINNYYESYKYFKTDDNALVYYVIFGTKEGIASKFAKMCGKQILPPKWSFDYCASTMAYTDASDSSIRMYEFLRKVKDLDLSCSAFYLSSGYTSIGDNRYVFNWNKGKFPDPAKFIQDFDNNQIKIIPNIKPAFLTSHPMYKYICDKGWFIKNEDGLPYLTQFWDGLGSYLDFTNKDAFEFWAKMVDEQLLGLGIQTSWNDNNEFDIKNGGAVACGFDGVMVKAKDIKTVLTYLMVLSSYSAQIKRYPNVRPFISSRSGGAGIRRLAQTWSGDNRSEFKDLRYCHNIGLTMSVSGFTFYGHDVGGFAGEMPSEELFLRWIQHGIFEPRFTIHSWNSDGSATMPWSYPAVFESVRGLFAERKSLLPYLYSMAYMAVEKNTPLTKPLCFCFDGVDTEADAMMFGNDILVYFIFDEGQDSIGITLPKEYNWYLKDKIYTGGETVSLKIRPTDEMPYFIKCGSVIPIDEAEYGFHKDTNIVFNVYPLETGTFESFYFDDDGVSFDYKENKCIKINFTVACSKDTVKVLYENIGENKMVPNIKLVKSDRRKLVIKEK